MLFLILILISGALVTYLFKVSLSDLNYWKKKSVKYVEPVPLFGNFLPTVTKTMSMPELIKYLYNAFPNERYMGIYQFHNPILLVRDLELIKSITIKNFDNFVDHPGFIKAEADPLWGKNLFASEGARWRDLRQTLSPAFTSSKMRAMFILFDECAKQLVNNFEEYNTDIIDVELKDVFTRYTTDIIASTAFGIKCDSLKNKNNDFLLVGRELSDRSGLNMFKFLLSGKYPKLCKFLGIKMVSDRVGNFFKSIVNQTITLRESKQIVRPDLIHLLMLARKGKLKFEEYTNIPEAGFAAVKESEVGKSGNGDMFLSNEDITAQAIVFFLGGSDSTATLLAFAGYELAINPLVQKKLKEEVIQTSLKCDGKISYEGLLHMKYLDMVVSETLRKWIQVPWLDRKCTKSFEIQPERTGEPVLKLEEGDIVWIPITAFHWDPKYFPNPEVFDPERFSDENRDKIQTASYIPFGSGPRNCIGSRYALLAAKDLLYNVLLHYDFVPTSKTRVPIKISANSAFLQPENGFHVGLKPNKKCH